jgi:hypothetical protein
VNPVVEACCRFARDYRPAGGSSRKALLGATGYRKARKLVTTEAIAECLRRHPGYLDDWAALRSDDRATSLALWEPEELEEGETRWVVTRAERRLYAHQDRIAAEAFFIAAYLDDARHDSSEWRMAWGCAALFAVAIAALTVYVSVAAGLSSALSWFLRIIP